MWYMWATQVSDLVCYVLFVNDASEWSCVLCDICERRKWAILCVMWYLWTSQVSDLVCITHKIALLRSLQISYNTQYRSPTSFTYITQHTRSLTCVVHKYHITHKITHLRCSHISHNTQDRSFASQVSDLVCCVIYVNDVSERSCVLCDICEHRKWAILCAMWYLWTMQVSDLVCYVIYVSDANEWSCVWPLTCVVHIYHITHKITHLRHSQISHNTQDHSLASFTYIT
jgi:hypothetical protein